MDYSIIRKYDIRGIVGKDLHISDGYEVGRKFGQVSGNICIGYDSRIHSPEIEKALIRGLTLSGANVIRIGLCSSPMLYAATKLTHAKIGIMVTASHNSSEYNGFKFFSNTKVFSEQEINKIIHSSIESSIKTGAIINVNIYDQYIKILKNTVESNAKGKIKIAWDCSNSPTSGIIRYIEDILPGHTHIVINNLIDGTFPLHNPDPTEEENLTYLINTVKEHGCDLGIALDGDGDRIRLIDNKGTIVSNDHLFMIFTREILEKHPRSKIIANIKISMKAHDFISQLGGQVITCATGHSLVKKKMIEENAHFAGELSGHFFFSDLGFDDGLYSAIKAINILLKAQQNLSDIVANLPKLYITNEVKIMSTEEKKFQIIESIKKTLEKQNIAFSDLDGIKVIASENKGWWILRASNTQNCITARCEGNTLEDFTLIKKMLYHYISQAELLNCSSSKENLPE
ncbi:phosphomannomutase [Wolbachia pipientis]|uniref:Phosphomannomutase n=1 Tax=Wolbachia pipientis TaxID=955 RepID=A0A1E7QJZ2_WOLPI|nr:phosphomannomutase/phosphoglucomutase [Wolbachia pipientis]OEY86676.1 phosphomannomutase [Wolbachia pipientis]